MRSPVDKVQQMLQISGFRRPAGTSNNAGNIEPPFSVFPDSLVLVLLDHLDYPVHQSLSSGRIWRRPRSGSDIDIETGGGEERL
jgi:hypothetical protein